MYFHLWLPCAFMDPLPSSLIQLQTHRETSPSRELILQVSSETFSLLLSSRRYPTWKANCYKEFLFSFLESRRLWQRGNDNRAECCNLKSMLDEVKYRTSGIFLRGFPRMWPLVGELRCLACLTSSERRYFHKDFQPHFLFPFSHSFIPSPAILLTLPKYTRLRNIAVVTCTPLLVSSGYTKKRQHEALRRARSQWWKTFLYVWVSCGSSFSNSPWNWKK